MLILRIRGTGLGVFLAYPNGSKRLAHETGLSQSDERDLKNKISGMAVMSDDHIFREHVHLGTQGITLAIFNLDAAAVRRTSTHAPLPLRYKLTGFLQAYLTGLHTLDPFLNHQIYHVLRASSQSWRGMWKLRLTIKLILIESQENPRCDKTEVNFRR